MNEHENESGAEQEPLKLAEPLLSELSKKQEPLSPQEWEQLDELNEELSEPWSEFSAQQRELREREKSLFFLWSRRALLNEEQQEKLQRVFNVQRTAINEERAKLAARFRRQLNENKRA